MLCFGTVTQYREYSQCSIEGGHTQCETRFERFRRAKLTWLGIFPVRDPYTIMEVTLIGQVGNGHEKCDKSEMYVHPSSNRIC